MELSNLWGLAGVPVVMALLEIVKAYGTDKRSWPLWAMVLGVGWNLGLAYLLKLPLVESVPVGIVVGLTASGLYSGVKAMRGL